MKITNAFIDELKPSAIRNITGQIDAKSRQGITVAPFAGGKPDKGTFPLADLKKITMEIFDQEDGESIQYAASSGYIPLRNTLAKLMQRFNVQTTPDNILTYAGSTQALACISRSLLIEKGMTVVCEKPTYIGALDIFRSYGADIEAIDMDGEGIMLDELEAVLKRKKAAFIYVIPDYQNPTGSIMSVERRQGLLQLAKRYQAPLIEDAPYALLGFEGKIYPAIKSFDNDDDVIYIGSISKTMAPGLRVGWIVAGNEFVQKMVCLKMIDDLQVNNIAQRQVHKFISEYDFDGHVEEIRQVYKRRCEKMLQVIDANFPKATKVIRPVGGMFLWLELDGIDALKLFDVLFKEDIAFVPGTFFYADGTGQNTMRLNFSMPTEEQIESKIAQMGRMICEYAQTANNYAAR